MYLIWIGPSSPVKIGEDNMKKQREWRTKEMTIVFEGRHGVSVWHLSTKTWTLWTNSGTISKNQCLMSGQVMWCWYHACYVCVTYERAWGFIWTKNYLSFEVRLRAPGPTFPLRLRPRALHRFKTKTVWHLPSFAPCEVFFNNFIL